jgi:hypothetical protein
LTARSSGDDGSNFVFFNQHESKVGFHLEHVVFVRDDHAIELFAVFQADFIGARRSYGNHACADGCA